MGKITFESIESIFTILNPQNNFSEDVHRIEVRKDPLLGDTSVYNPFLKDKARAFFGDNDPALVQKLAEESAKNCIFCEGMVEKITGKFPADIIPEGRIRVGEALLFANIFSIGKYHPVVSLSRAHFLKLSEFSPEIIANGLLATQQFLKALYRNESSMLFTTVNANYLFPAGASLVHPHLQTLVTPMAYSYHARILDACRSYYHKHGTAYHADLIDEEKRSGSRYIAQRGPWHWMSAFSPTGSNEIDAVHEAESDFVFMNEASVRQLAEGISKVLAFYESIGYLSFNFTLFSVRQPLAGEGFHCLLKIINRQNLYPNYRNDDYFLQKMLQTELIINLPENLAEKLRGSF